MGTMKTVRMHAFGDVDVLRYEEVERQARVNDGIIVFFGLLLNNEQSEGR